MHYISKLKSSFSVLSTLKKPSKNYTCYILRRFGLFLIDLQSKIKKHLTMLAIHLKIKQK